jgi:hypothetical protein
VPVVVEFGSMGRGRFLGTGQFLSQLGTSKIGNPNLLWGVGLDPLIKLSFPGGGLLLGKAVVMLT